MTRGKEYALKLTYKDHQDFLGYWHDTQKKAYSSEAKKRL